MKTQLALRLDEDLVELARRAAERQNRSLANFVEVVLAESLMAPEGELPIVSLVDADFDGIEAIDDNGVVDEAESARLIAEEETLAFLGWYRARQATPTIAQLKNHLDEIKEDYMRIFGPRLAHLSAKDRQTIETMVQSMMDQVARQPIQKLKRDAAGEGTVPISLAAATLHLFGLDGSGSGAEVVTESVEAPDGAPVRETA